VAIEPQYALEKGLPDTVALPHSDGKLTYVIEAYHAIHCVVRIMLPVLGRSMVNLGTRRICASTT
jgi:hypothetical protein